MKKIVIFLLFFVAIISLNFQSIEAQTVLTTQQLEKIVEKLGGPEKALEFIGEPVKQDPNSKWTRKDGVIYFSVISGGATGEEWITRLTSKGVNISSWAESVLRSENFKPTNGIVYNIAVLEGDNFSDDKVPQKIRAKADGLKFLTPPAEIACLIWWKFSDKELEDMGLQWIVVMHEQSGLNVFPWLLSFSCVDHTSWLSAYCGGDGDYWGGSDTGFAFVK